MGWHSLSDQATLLGWGQNCKASSMARGNGRKAFFQLHSVPSSGSYCGSWEKYYLWQSICCWADRHRASAVLSDWQCYSVFCPFPVPVSTLQAMPQSATRHSSYPHQWKVSVLQQEGQESLAAGGHEAHMLSRTNTCSFLFTWVGVTRRLPSLSLCVCRVYLHDTQCSL